MSTRPKSHFCTVAVWGEAYVGNFLRLALPSFLAPGNIPACAAIMPVKFQIVTRPEDVATLEKHPVMAALTKHAAVSIEPHLTPDCFKGNRYSVMAFANRIAIAESLEHGDILSILPPDCIIADGSLSFGLRKIVEGYRAVILGGPKGVLETAAPLIAAAPYRNTEGTCISISSEDLVAMQALHPHPMAQIIYWRRQPFSGFPSCIYWAAGKESTLAHCFHLHPFFVDMSQADQQARDCGTQDGDLLVLARIAPEQTFVPVRSQDMFVIELSSLNFDPMASVPVEVADKTSYVLDWVRSGGACRLHRDQFRQHAFMLQGRETVDWDRVIEESDRDLEGVIRGLAIVDREEEEKARHAEKERWKLIVRSRLKKIVRLSGKAAGWPLRFPNRIALGLWRRVRVKLRA